METARRPFCAAVWKGNSALEPIYVTGHKNPDTDSIVAAIAYASLRNALGERQFVAARIGDVSDQTQLVLDKFGFAAPLLIHNVRTQVQDLAFDRPPIMSSAVTLHHAWKAIFSSESHDVTLPVTDEDGKLFGMLSASDIASYDMRFVSKSILSEIPLFNLISALDGHLLDDGVAMGALSGELVIALPTENGLPPFTQNDIVLCGNQPDVMDAVARDKAGCLIVCNAGVPAEQAEKLAGLPVIITPLSPYRAARLIIQAVPISHICRTTELVGFHLADYIDDVRDAMKQSRFRSYPVLDGSDRVVGTLSRFHLLSPNRKKLVLVDHNEILQSVPGLEQAEILEIIDHHRLADVQTGAPIYVRNEPVGSTCTIITSMFMEKGIVPSKNLAGLLAAAIISDTILFKSPTCTNRDRVMAERMAKQAGISLDELGREMFAVSLADVHNVSELLFSDFKRFHIAGHTIGIGQFTCFNSLELPIRRDEMIRVMEAERAEHEYDMLLLMITDVLREGTELLAVGDIDTVESAFNVKVVDHAAFLPGVLSRKKQVVPALSLLWG